MKKISFNVFYQVCIIIIVFALLATQLFGIFFHESTLDDVFSKNQIKIEALMENMRPPITMDEVKYDFSLPLGTQLYSKTETNLKLRYETAYFTVHILSSDINVSTYALSNYEDGMRTQLHVNNYEPILVYSEQMNTNYIRVGLFSKNVEVSYIVPKSSLESMTLKGLEILRNVQVKDYQEQAIFIGSNTDGTPQTILDQGLQSGADEGEQDESNIEIKIKE